MNSTVIPSRTIARPGSIVLASFFALLGFAAVAASFYLCGTLLEKLEWWESEDWFLPSMLLVLFFLPGALATLALARRFFEDGLPPQDDLARRSRWAVRATGLPFLALALELARAAWTGRSYVPVTNGPSADDHHGRLIQLGVFAAIAAGIGLYGWFAPRATYRGWLRFVACLLTGSLFGYVVLQFLASFKTLVTSDLRVIFVLCAPMVAASALTWFLTRRPTS